jgi:hypothetical protein
MTSKSKFRPSPAMVIACIALFATTAGTALAAALPKNSVRSAQIVNGAVKTVDLGKNAIKSGKIADGTIGAADLGADSVGSDEIAKDAVTADEVATDAVDSDEIAKDAVKTDEIADNAVGSAKVANESLSSADLGPNSVGSSELQASSVRSSELGPIVQVTNTTAIANGASGGVSVACPAGTTVISGGGQPANFGVEMTSTLRSGNGWLYQARNTSGGASTLRVFAYCLAA